MEEIKNVIEEIKKDVVVETKSVARTFKGSEKLDKLFGALAKAQSEFGVALKKSQAFNFKYANLTELVRVTRPALAKNGLTIVYPTTRGEDGNPMVVTAILGHATSGQYLEASMNVKVAPRTEGKGGNMYQDLGACLGYAERYTYTALTGVVTQDAPATFAKPTVRKYDR